MPIKYNVIKRRNPRNPADPTMFYASTKADGEVSFKALSKEIAQGSTTVSDTDVLAVLNDLNKLLAKHLSEGKIVRLGDFGTFQAIISSNGEAEAAKVTAASIKGAKIQFRPGEDLRNMLKAVKFEKYSK